VAGYRPGRVEAHAHRHLARPRSRNRNGMSTRSVRRVILRGVAAGNAPQGLALACSPRPDADDTGTP